MESEKKSLFFFSLRMHCPSMMGQRSIGTYSTGCSRALISGIIVNGDIYALMAVLCNEFLAWVSLKNMYRTARRYRLTNYTKPSVYTYQFYRKKETYIYRRVVYIAVRLLLNVICLVKSVGSSSFESIDAAGKRANMIRLSDISVESS